MDSQDIELFPGLCPEVVSKEELIQKVFPQIEDNYTNHSWLSERAILAPKNSDVNLINQAIQDRILQIH